MRSLATAEDHRCEVEAVAVDVFSERGFYDTTTTEVARAAGISQAYLYKLYPDKTSLFVAALDHGSDRLTVLMSQRLETSPDAQHALGAVINEIAKDWRAISGYLSKFC